tara:strand:- start:87 stop:281 length:195 start_codon:yes stop_codon:yes gene_type:complete
MSGEIVLIEPNKSRINVGTTGHIDWGKPILYTPAGIASEENPLMIKGDHGKRSKKGKRRKDWQD